MRPLSGAIALAAVAWAAAFAPACSPTPPPDSGYRVECTIHPSPPVVGPATIEIAIADPAGLPVAGARVRVEGDMNHAGMVPSVASAEEVEAGRYRANLEFTMAGDWFLLVDAKLRDERKIERTVPVPSVRGR